MEESYKMGGDVSKCPKGTKVLEVLDVAKVVEVMENSVLSEPKKEELVPGVEDTQLPEFHAFFSLVTKLKTLP